MIDDALVHRSVSSSADLEGFVVDARIALTELGRFFNVKVETTEDPRKAVFISCSLGDRSRSVDTIVDLLEQIWTQHLAYFGGQSPHRIRVGQGQIELRFMSEAEPEDLFVTGSILVDTSALTET